MADQKIVPLVSIVVLNYNKHDDLVRNLSRLREIRYPELEVLVVDNCSTDGSREMVRTEFPEYQLIEAPFNGGVSIGRNLGFREARGEYVIYLDDDAVAPVDIVEKTVKIFQSDEKIGCLAYCVRQMPQDILCNDLSRQWIINYHGAGHAFRTSVLKKIDYLDENFFYGGEEIDSTLRSLEKGYKTRFTPEIIIDHYARIRSGKEYGRRASSWVASWCWFYMKHFPIYTALLCVWRVWIDTAFQSLRRRSFDTPVVSLWKIFSGLPRILKLRQVASAETIAFYMDPSSEPSHYTKSITKKVLSKIFG
ncbi:glycosyltransferase family 2 protein [Pseudomonadota bacterium]